jgi:hypothetical protein
VLLAVAASLLSLAARAGETPARDDILAPEDVKAGMKGFGLTVFSGHDPERFTIEVIGRLRNMFPQQDIILIRSRDEKLKDSRIAGGMSGSPIYVECADGKERLIGALAYAWSFEVEAIAGVTPITNMLAGLEDTKREAAKADNTKPNASEHATASPGDAVDAADLILSTIDPERARAALTSTEGMLKGPSGGSRAFAAGGLDGELRPVATPLMVSGLGLARMDEVRRIFSPLGLEPVRGGAGSGTGAPGKGGKISFTPGDAIGVQLMRGDSDFTAIGTVTYVEGDHILAFGHPFFQAGRWEAPVTKAEVVLILASQSRSIKLANAGQVAGRLLDDLQPCIVAEIGGKVEMTPCTVKVHGPGRATRTFNFEMIRHPSLTARLAFFALSDSVMSAFPLADDAVLTVKQRLEISGGRTLELETVTAAQGSFSYAMTSPLTMVLSNPFERVSIERMDFDVRVEPGRRTARITSAEAARREAKPGDEVPVRVRVRPFGRDWDEEEEIELIVRVPADARPGKLPVTVMPGSAVRPDVAPIRNLDEYIAGVALLRRPTTLVAIVPRPTRGLRRDGRVMPALPSSVMNVLAPASAPGPGPSRDRTLVERETDWVLTGSASVVITVRKK